MADTQGKCTFAAMDIKKNKLLRQFIFFYPYNPNGNLLIV